ncbi:MULTISPECIES: SRPBCC family protein [unclassified Mycobacteroides]|uniref:type II toxin-antitoxin system Rv0910 family toxin n=1 Tax=unclassified Mycobacteroides TaxID=2618759 RepID=UPI001396A0B1|nr:MULTISPECIES: SRPBCC family protein [unclassified Mycobacteroides]
MDQSIVSDQETNKKVDPSMPSAFAESRINAPCERVWNFAVDFSRWSEWNRIVTNCGSKFSTEITEGAVVSAAVNVMGMVRTISLTVNEYRPFEKLVFSGSGIAGTEITFTLTVRPDGDSTVLTLGADFVGLRMVGVVGTAIHQDATHALTESLTRFASLI